MAIQIQFRRGTAAQWTSANPIMAEGEMGIELDTDQFKIGDGVTAWSLLAYGGIQGPSDHTLLINIGTRSHAQIDTLLDTLPSKEDNTNKVTSISGASTNIQYPSAKLLFDQLALKSPVNNVIATTLDFGVGGDYLSSTVAAAWVNSQSVINLTISPHLTDHDVEDVLLEQLVCTLGTVVDGVSFDVHLHAPSGTWGRYIIKSGGV